MNTLDCSIISVARPWSKDELVSMGFNPIRHFDPRYPEGRYVHFCTQEQGKRYMYFRRGYMLSEFEQSLRKNWISVLEDARPDIHLFLESDATPTVTSDNLLQLVRSITNIYPDIDLIKLFINQYSTEPGGDSDAWSICLPNKKDRTLNSAACWGSHAYWVVNRDKLREVFMSVALPTDIAVEYAINNNLLKVAGTKHNWFYQKQHPKNHKYIEVDEN